MFDVYELLIEAINETKTLYDSEIFLVRELFIGYKWNRIPYKDQLLLGILFLKYVNKTSGDLHAIEKTPSTQQRHIEIEDR